MGLPGMKKTNLKGNFHKNEIKNRLEDVQSMKY